MNLIMIQIHYLQFGKINNYLCKELLKNINEYLTILNSKLLFNNENNNNNNFCTMNKTNVNRHFKLTITKHFITDSNNNEETKIVTDNKITNFINIKLFKFYLDIE